MSKTVIGADVVMRKLKLVAEKASEAARLANKKTGEEIVATAKVLIPVSTGLARSKIDGTERGDGYFIDFGPLSSILEGGRKAGTSPKGHRYPAMSPRRFVNPTLSALDKRRKARAKRAVKKAIKDAMNG